MTKLSKRISARNDFTLIPVKKFIIFSIGEEEYAIDILKVNEISGSIKALSITKIADAPEHIKGIINLHDRIIPIVDLRVFYHLQPILNDEVKIIIILDIMKKMVGIAVDNVSDIIELTEKQIKPAPDFFTNIYSNYIQGIGTLDKKILIILDVEKLLFSDDVKINQFMNKDS